MHSRVGLIAGWYGYGGMVWIAVLGTVCSDRQARQDPLGLSGRYPLKGGVITRFGFTGKERDNLTGKG